MSAPRLESYMIATAAQWAACLTTGFVPGRDGLVALPPLSGVRVARFFTSVH